MKFQRNFFYFLLIIAPVIFSSCKSTDPFQAKVNHSTISLAELFLNEYENPKSTKGIEVAYEKLAQDIKSLLSYDSFEQVIRKRYPQKQIIKRKVEIDTWEKFDLSDGSALIYILKKDKFNPFTRKFSIYEMLRLHIVKEADHWAVQLDEPSQFSGLTVIASGEYASLDPEGVENLKETIKKDARQYQFRLDLENKETHEESMAITCIQEGEKLYDQEQYRKALMQFQKAKSIDPSNQKADVYIKRCQKAIALGLTKK